MMGKFIFYGTIFFQVYVQMCLWNVAFNWKKMRHYDKIYDDLRNRKFYWCKEQEIVISTPLFTDNMILWNYKTGFFCLKNGVFLTSSPLHFLNSPYDIYWHWKFKRWFKKNLDFNKLEQKKVQL